MQEPPTTGAHPRTPWCERDHQPGDHPEDHRHQGVATIMAMVVASSTPPATHSQAIEAVAYADQPPGAPLPWIRIESLESRHIQVAMTPESAQNLVHALSSVLAALARSV